ncbi:hypothetical protein [Nitrospira sp. Kam-Ns4a]
MVSERSAGSPASAGGLVALAGLVAAGVALRWRHVMNWGYLLSGDDGVVALMGLHILNGAGFPLMFYGQHYMGSLDAMVAAVAFGWLGVSAKTFKLTLLLYAAATLVLVGWTAHRLWGPSRACLVVGLLAVSPAAIRWQMDQPNYGMLYLLAALLMALTVRLLTAPGALSGPRQTALLCGWAFVAGAGVWMHSLILSLALPVPFLLWLRGALPTGRRLGLVLACALLGMGPLLLHNIVHPFATLRQFVGFFLDVSSRSEVEGLSWLEIVLRGLRHKVDPVTVGSNLLVAIGGYSLRDYPVLATLSYPAVVAFLILVAASAVAAVRKANRLGWRTWGASQEGSLLAWLLLSAFLVVVLGSTRSRYMALLVPLAAFLLAGRWRTGGGSRLVHQVRLGLLAGLGLYLAAAGVVLTVVQPLTLPNPVPGLAQFLESNGLRLGYAGFELAYPLVVETQEAVRVSPLAGPLVDDRYPAYTRAVEAAPSPFYIYAEGEPLGEILANYLRRQGIGFEDSRIAGQRVLWGLTRPVRPDEFLPEPYLSMYKRVHL